MLELANDRRRFGSPRLHELLRREELVQNHKRTERIYQEENLSLRTRKRVKRPSHARIVQAGPAGPDEQWAMDFVSDSLMGGRRIRILTIADLWDRSSPALEVDMSLVVMGWSRPNKAGSIAYRKTYARRPFHEDSYHYWH